MQKIQLLVSVNFFLQIFSRFKLSHMPIDRASLALQNGIHDISPQSRYWEQKVKKQYFFLHIRFHGFLSISTKYLGQKSIAKKIYTPFCSQFNSATN